MLYVFLTRKEVKMEEKKIAICADQITKIYKLYEKPSDRMKEALGLTRKKLHKEHYALQGVDMTVYQGETVGIIGTNGSGKSTILKIITGVLNPTKGNLTVNGRISALLELGAGFNMEYNGIENIYLNGAILGMSRAEVNEKIEDIIEFSECRQFIDTPVKRYSSGMFVKLAFSVAAHLDNDIMLMDEVLAVGDMAFQKKCIEKMLDVVKNSGKTIIYVSHNMQTIRQLCSRGVVLHKGEVVYDGDVEEAIGIYLNQAKMQSKASYEFTDEDRRWSFLTNKTKMHSLEVLDRDEMVVRDGEKLKFRLKWEALEDVKGLSLRMMVHNNDQAVIATTVCHKFMDCKKGEEYEKVFEMDVSPLSTGTYKVLMVQYESDELGSVIDADAVYPGLIFEREKTSSLDWKAKLFGDVELKEMELL